MKSRSAKVHYTDEEVEAFYDLKKAVASAQKLFFIDSSQLPVLQTDVSNYGIKGYLYQVVDGIERPIVFVSKSLQKEQLSWSTPEKEVYAVYYSSLRVQSHIRDIYFRLRTDHENLTKAKDGSSPKVLWKLEVQSLSFDFEFVKGKDSKLPDDFSRLVPDNPELEVSELVILDSTEVPKEVYETTESDHSHIAGHHGQSRTVDKLHAMVLETMFDSLLNYAHVVKKCHT